MKKVASLAAFSRAKVGDLCLHMLASGEAKRLGQGFSYMFHLQVTGSGYGFGLEELLKFRVRFTGGY
eukprot:1036345-Amorphochlora_amoeboformis.AAC.1